MSTNHMIFLRPPFRATDEWESSSAGGERLGWSTRPGTTPTNVKPPWIERDRERRSQIKEQFSFIRFQIFSFLIMLSF